jgi:(5-formylfuran-3-yl)methyl phosphate synthase
MQKWVLIHATAANHSKAIYVTNLISPLNMKVLISPKDEFEAKAAVDGGADIIDVKNPDEGSLGANFPWVIRQVRSLVPQNIEVSATIGDFPHLPGSASLAALGAAVSGADYVKVGLKGSKTRDEAFFLMQHVTRTVKEYDDGKKVVLAGYADYHRAVTLDPFLLPEVARSAGCDVVMVDTFIKDGKSLFDFMDVASCKRFVDTGHMHDLEVALAGSIKLREIPILKRIGVDIIGIRGAACSHGDRLTGTIQTANVTALMDLARQA